MDTFQPLINLLMLLTVLSVVVERVTNTLKLRRPAMRQASADEGAEKQREQEIGQFSLAASVGFALLVKANLFEVLSRLDAPWDTLGWARFDGTGLVRASVLTDIPSALYAAGGCIITGVALGFGSKFWHDMLDIVFNARESLKQFTKRAGHA
jgi:hypothetical protein